MATISQSKIHTIAMTKKLNTEKIDFLKSLDVIAMLLMIMGTKTINSATIA